MVNTDIRIKGERPMTAVLPPTKVGRLPRIRMISPIRCSRRPSDGAPEFPADNPQ